ncbi:CDP-glycerol glycerophosphotransferase family protein [Apilactobacillus xinyiensis]|uniref:CDP-glycerol glycerophosphotransferase family protein n=1 Tax=Apilactobacillus xinyiensis TaxID=2841032 RepID=UPI00336519AE
MNSLKNKLINCIKILIRGGLIVINDGFIYLPIKKNLVIFESFNGKDINDNPAAIYREWIKTHNKNLAYFSVKPKLYNKLKAEYPEIKLVKRFMPKWVYLMARANFWAFNSRIPGWWKKNRNTTYIQTWHGTPLKKLGVDIDNVEMPNISTKKYKHEFIKESHRWSYLIAPNQYSKDIFSRAFNFKGQSLDIGYPRNDVLYKNNNLEYIKTLKKDLLGNSNCKVITYAPTWRDDDYTKKGAYNFELPFDLKAFFNAVDSDTILVIRPHYLIKDNINIKGFENRVKILADNDISQIYLISDLLITDYSSVMFDYANLKRPMLFYAYDLEHYRDHLRGFYFNYKTELPGPLAQNEQQFLKWIAIFNNAGTFNGYDIKFNNFYNKYCSWESDQSAFKVTNLMEELSNGK